LFQISKLILRDHQGTMSRSRMRYTKTSWSVNVRVPVGWPPVDFGLYVAVWPYDRDLRRTGPSSGVLTGLPS